MTRSNAPWRPTLRDVAHEADTSLKTASRVVNGEGGVSDTLTARVEEAVAKLGYSPDSRARDLRSGSAPTGAFGFLQNDVANPFFAGIFRGLDDVATASGRVVLSGSSQGEQELQTKILRSFIERRVDGLVVVPVGSDLAVLEIEAARGTPVVFVDLMPSKLIGDVVLTDHYRGSVEAVTHLISSGHRRIAFIGDRPAYYSASERLRGYEAALTSAAIELDPDLIVRDAGTFEIAEAEARRLLDLDQPPTALFTAQNFVSIGALKALHRTGNSHRVAMVGFDDIENADILDPGLTVVTQHPRELGKRATEMLLRRLDGYTGPPEISKLDADLIRRGSGELPPNS